jgi:hypothetical protein
MSTANIENIDPATEAKEKPGMFSSIRVVCLRVRFFLLLLPLHVSWTEHLDLHLSSTYRSPPPSPFTEESSSFLQLSAWSFKEFSALF